eukprot:NODE_485_length_6930_cov_0.490411.p1 type:complete len:467 gc:universal NODE_485_length_6930_cov_0.490411:265-1665(+)
MYQVSKPIRTRFDAQANKTNQSDILNHEYTFSDMSFDDFTKFLSTDCWDAIFEKMTKKELLKLGPINKNASISLYRCRWKKLVVSNLSDTHSLDQIFEFGTFPYQEYVEELTICLRKTDTVRNLIWLRHLTELKKIVLQSSEDFDKNYVIDPTIISFLSTVFEKNKKLWNITGGCKFLEAIRGSPVITTVTLCCEWTKNSAAVVSSFPNMRKLILKKKIQNFQYFGRIEQVRHLIVETSWMDQSSFLRLNKQFPLVGNLNINQEWGAESINLSGFQYLTSLECSYLNVATFPPQLKSLKIWGIKLEHLYSLPIYTLNELQTSAYLGHVFDFLHPIFDHLPSMMNRIVKMSSFAFALEDGTSQIIISNNIKSYCSPYVQYGDLQIASVEKNLCFAILPGESIPTFIEYIGDSMLSILKSGSVISYSASIQYSKFLKSLYSSMIRDTKDENVIRDINEYYRRKRNNSQ